MLLLQIDEARVKVKLNQEAQNIIASMQKYSNNDGIYTFPRYKNYKAGLFDKQYKTIFSTLDFNPSSFKEGVYKQDNHYYLIYTLADGYYFNSKYLIVSTIHTANEIYFFALLTLLTILVILFIFSLLLLRNFSTPFEEINKQLDNFIKDSMHEINTPLSIININSDLFSNKYGTNKYIQRIKSASKTLATIYDDMDYLIKEGRVEHKKSRLNMGEFIQNRVDYFQEVAHLKNIEIKTEIENSIYYNISKIKLQRIIDNTLSNAIKYSHDSNPIEIKLYKNNKNIVFKVEDYGVGITNINKIFSRYYRENETKGGFGIGLNIVKDIIDSEDINLNVSSVVDKGTIFCYSLKL
jgi:signal transduction histidine kinase